MRLEEAIHVLGLENTELTPENIRKAFRQKSKLYHPDLGGDADMMKKVIEANNFLSEPKNLRRMTYTHRDILNIVRR